MDEWTWRENVASWIHRLAFKFAQPVVQDILMHTAEPDKAIEHIR